MVADAGCGLAQVGTAPLLAMAWPLGEGQRTGEGVHEQGSSTAPVRRVESGRQVRGTGGISNEFCLNQVSDSEIENDGNKKYVGGIAMSPTSVGFLL